jgi:cation diffusion facilitator family transporter
MSVSELKVVKKATVISVMVNLFLSFIKIVAGYFGKSNALMADGIHSFSDLFTDFLLFFGVKYWNKPMDENHPYGHRRIENIITGILGLSLIVIGIFIGYENLFSLEKRSYKISDYTFYVAILSVVFKEFLFRYTKKLADEFNLVSLEANAWHHRSDAFSSVPVVLSLGIYRIYPNFYFMDALGAIIVSGIIIFVGWDFFYSSVSKLSDSSAPEEVIINIEKICYENKEVKDVHKIRTRYFGNEIAVDLHIEVDENLTIKEAHDIAADVKRRLLNSSLNIFDVIIHIEPYEVK